MSDLSCELGVRAYARPLLVPVRGRAKRRGWLVRLSAGEAHGVGEAACWRGFGAGARATRTALRAFAARPARLGPALDAARALDLDALTDALDHATREAWAPEARHALELALLDLAGRTVGRSLASLLAPAPRASVALHSLVADLGAARAAVAAGARTLKVKVGDASWPRDLELLDAVRAGVGDEVALRVDVNGAWSPQDAPARLQALAARGVALVEQPIPAGDVEALARVRRAGGARVAIDEGLRGEDDLDAVLRLEAADAVVLKPQALGGLLPARRLARRAAAAGLEVVITHSLETAVGRAGALALAAGLPGDPVCGLGPALARDVALLPAPISGRAPLPTGAGLGLSFVSGGDAWSW